MFFTSIFCGSLFCGSAVHIHKEVIAGFSMDQYHHFVSRISVFWAFKTEALSVRISLVAGAVHWERG